MGRKTKRQKSYEQLCAKKTCETCKYNFQNCYGENLCSHKDFDKTDINLLLENCILYEEDE